MTDKKRVLRSIDYTKSAKQPILCEKGIFIRTFQTAEGNQGMATIDVATGTVLGLCGMGKNGKIYRLTEFEAIQWTPEEMPVKEPMTVAKVEENQTV